MRCVGRFFISSLPNELTTSLQVCARVKEWADKLGPNDWVVGGIVGAITLDKLAVENSIKKLDVAAGGRPVLLRDDSLHNRWALCFAADFLRC
jgi:predicted amidohydrolase YtcJ